MADRKLSFLVRKISKEVGISEHTEKNVDIVFRNLTLQNKEYQRKNAGEIRSLVSSELSELVSAAHIMCNENFAKLICTHADFRRH